jgi:hypothetical protein
MEGHFLSLFYDGRVVVDEANVGQLSRRQKGVSTCIFACIFRGVVLCSGRKFISGFRFMME